MTELQSTSKQLQNAQFDNHVLQTKLDRLLCVSGALDKATLVEVEDVERELRRALEAVESKKVVLVRDAIENQKEQRQCVVCQEREKCVVLLPCRHMCLCEPCSLHEGLMDCPLCREAILHRIGVFS